MGTRRPDHLSAVVDTTPAADAVPAPSPGGPARAGRIDLRMLAGYLVGSAFLSVALRVDEGSALFPVLAFAAAVAWVVGAGHRLTLPAGRDAVQQLVTGAAIGLPLAAIAIAVTGIMRDVPVFLDNARQLVGHAEAGITPITVLVIVASGVCEEIYFRGALFQVVHRHRIIVSAVLYTLSVVGSGNFALIAAAAVFGVVAGVTRQLAGSVLTPAAMHVTFSLTMLAVLPGVVS